ncbi:MAG: hypothetical protein RSC00_09040, partial [Ruthenibacterium sp.]
VLPFCCGVTAHSTDAAGILRSAVWQLETLTGQPHFEIETRPDDRRADKKSPTLQDWREQLTALCALYSAGGKRLLLAVDAVDQLLSDDPAAALQFLPCRLTDTVKTFITCLDTFPLPGKLAAASLPALSKEDRRIALTSILTAHGKTLSQPVENALVCKEDAHNPLYLYLAVSRLLLMNADDFAAIHSRGDGIQAIVAQQIELIAGMPDDLEAMGRALILEAGQRVNPAMAHAAAQYLAVSRHGLRLDDLAALLAADAVYFNALTFSQFVNYMNELFFLRADGRYDFMHKSLRAGLLSACENKQAMHASLVRHCFSLAGDDPVRVQEITYHCILADDRAAFVNYLDVLWQGENTPARQTALTAAACDVHDLAMQDSGKWFCQTLQDLPPMDDPKNQLLGLAVFVNADLDAAFRC